MFVNGHNDPWHALSVLDNVSPTVTAFVIENTAHCAHEYPSSPNDSPSLVAARQVRSSSRSFESHCDSLGCVINCDITASRLSSQAIEAQIANWLYL